MKRHLQKELEESLLLIFTKMETRKKFDESLKRLETMSLGLDMQTTAGDCSSEHFHRYKDEMKKLIPQLYGLAKELGEDIDLSFYEGMIKETGGVTA